MQKQPTQYQSGPQQKISTSHHQSLLCESSSRSINNAAIDQAYERKITSAHITCLLSAQFLICLPHATKRPIRHDVTHTSTCRRSHPRAFCVYIHFSGAF